MLKHKAIYSVEKMCKALKISTNAYYTWLRTKDKKKVNLKTQFYKERIKIVFNNSRQTYGSHRIQKQLEREGVELSRSYIAILMKELRIKSILAKKYRVQTTDSNHQLPIAENLLNREFSTLRLGQKWVSDITYVQIANKWNYVTTIMDLADRKILSCIISQDMTTQNTVYKAWLMARKKRNITDDHIFHSDRGVQYASTLITNLLNTNIKIRQSMSRKGNCWDNAVAESFFKTLKYECTNRYYFKNIIQAEIIIQDYIEWYNYSRLHSTLNYLTPAEMELKLLLNNNKNVA